VSGSRVLRGIIGGFLLAAGLIAVLSYVYARGGSAWVIGPGAVLEIGLLFVLGRFTRRELANRSLAGERERGQLALTSAITENLGEGVFALDEGGRFTFVNPSGERMLGWTAGDLLGRDEHAVIHSRDPDGIPFDRTECPLTRVLASGLPYRNHDDAWMRRDGVVIPVAYSSTPIVEEERIRGSVVAFHDITERKRAEADLAERVALAAFQAAIGGALTRADTLGHALNLCAEAMVNHLGAAMASIWRLDAKDGVLELVGSAWSDRPLFGPAGRVPVGEFRIGAIARDRRPALLDLASGPERADDKDWASREGMVAFAGYPMIVEDRVVGVLALFARHRLTEVALEALASVADEIALGIDRSRAAQALEKSEASTRALLQNMLTGVITANERGVIETLNPAAERTFGWTAQELVGRQLASLLPAADNMGSRAFLSEAREKAMGRVTEWEARRKSGEVFPMELALFHFQTPDGRRHLAGSVRDISERREVDRLKKEFVSTVSHELRTPLTSIRGSLGLLSGGVLGELPPEAKEIVTVAERNVVRLVRLINDILDLERLDTGRMEMRFENAAIADLMTRSLEAVRAFADAEGVSVEIGAADGARVLADGDRAVQVIVNLLSNAIKFSPRGERVTVSVFTHGQWVEIRVADRGRGIPAAQRESVFERFRQVESSDARQKGGSGLGLAICKAIVEQHGGRIGVESEEGKGSTFWFHLPAARATGEILPGQVAGAAEALVVEDDETLARLLGRQLGGEGIAVCVVRSGSEAVARARERRPNLMVLDVDLPDGDGFFVVTALRQDPRLRTVPLLVYTAQDLTAAERERLRLGPTKFLTKSRFSEDGLRAAARELVGRTPAGGVA
jgi:PAS domain S-box-containing protein